MTWNPEIFHQAGLQTRHIVPHLPVTRETVSSWLNGRRTPSEHVMEQAMFLQCAVQLAIDAEDLPMPHRADLSRAETDLRIHQVIHRAIQRAEWARLTPTPITQAPQV